MYRLVLVLALVTPGTGGPGCPAACRCEADGSHWRTRCVDAGLTGLPRNISASTTFLELSMNNLHTLPEGSFSKLHLIKELRLAGNGLTRVPKNAFAGLENLQVLTLHNNDLKRIPSEALRNLRNLLSLRLDANSIFRVPTKSFRGLRSLHHLWLDDNRLRQVPVAALAGLTALQAVTFALNNITHIPKRAFHTLRHLLVLHLHDNQIHFVAERCFHGLHNLETLDMSSNRLQTFPAAIRALRRLREISLHRNNIRAIPEYAFVGNPSLEIIKIHNNPVRSVGRTSFQELPELLTLSLSGTADVASFPDFTGTTNVETLTITETHISALPSSMCEDLPNLRQLDLSHNQIQFLPNFTSCRKIQKIDLRHNLIHEIRAGTFQKMSDLRYLDLTSNRLSSLPLGHLQTLTHVRLAGNPELTEPLPLHLLPNLRMAEMPFAFQCCVLVASGASSRSPSGADTGSSDPERRATSRCVEARKSVLHCSPAPGPLRPHQTSVPPWLSHFGIWFFVIPSIMLNARALVSVFLNAEPEPASSRLLGVLFSVHVLLGLCGSSLAALDLVMIDPLTPCCPERGVQDVWGALDFLVRLCSEARVFLMMAVVSEHRKPSFDVRPSAIVAAGCCALALLVSALPHVYGGEISGSHRCVLPPHRGQTSWGYNTALVVLNFFCYLVMGAVHTLPYRHRGIQIKRPAVKRDRATVHTLTFLLLSHCLLSASEALLWFWSSTQTSSPSGQGQAESAVLLIAALPAFLDPLLYMFFRRRFADESSVDCPCGSSYRLKAGGGSSQESGSPEDADGNPGNPSKP